MIDYFTCQLSINQSINDFINQNLTKQNIHNISIYQIIMNLRKNEKYKISKTKLIALF